MLNHSCQEMPCSSNIAINNLNTFCWYSCKYSNLGSQSVNSQAKQTLAGSSGSVRYDSLSSGTYIFRIVARAANGERYIDRRKIHIGMYDCITVFSKSQVVKTLYSKQFSNAYWHKHFMCNSVYILVIHEDCLLLCRVILFGTSH